MKTLLIATALLFSANAMAAAKVSLIIDMDAKATYEKTGEKSFKKLYTLVTGTVHVKIQDGLNVLANVKQPINKRENEKGTKEIHVLGKDLVRIVDIDPQTEEFPANIDEKVAAKVKIKRDYIKSIKISKEQLEGLYEEVLTAAGLNQLRGMQVTDGSASVETDFSMSDMSCKGKKGSATLNCENNVKLSIIATAK